MKLRKKGLITFLIFIFAFSIVGCNNTSYEKSANIIEAKELKELIGNADTIIVDARSKEDYSKGHVAEAINLDPMELTVSEPVNAMIAPKEKIEAVLSEKGISNDSKLYIYDNNGGVNASRVWWTLKLYGHDVVKVINNGQKALELGDFEMSLEVPKLEPTAYKTEDLQKEKIVDLENVKKVANDESSDVNILDVRSLAEYEEGAIPGAIFYPHTKNLYSDGTFKSSRNIYLSYKDLGLERDDEIIIYCKSSFRATQTALLLEEAGFTNVKIYDGAWLEWSMGDMPVKEKEEKVVPTQQDAS